MAVETASSPSAASGVEANTSASFCAVGPLAPAGTSMLEEMSPDSCSPYDEALSTSSLISAVTGGSWAQDTPSWQKKNFVVAKDSETPLAIR